MTDPMTNTRVAVSEAELTIALCGKTASPCQHKFVEWREFDDGCGGETVCEHCGIGAMAHTLSLDI